jgi:DNA replication protein DnaC
MRPCVYCGGTGWKSVKEATDRRVVRCDCYFELKGKRLLEAAQIPARYSQCSFSTYWTNSNSLLAKAKLDVEAWAKQYPLDRRGLALFGLSGVGKTHLASAALKVLTDKGFHCLFSDYRDLLKQIQNSYNPAVQATELSLLQPVFEAEVLLLDDLGAVKPSQWVWDTVSLILNNRYNNNRTTLITSNYVDGPAAGTQETDEREALQRQAPNQLASTAVQDEEGIQKRGREETLGDRIGNRMRSRLFEMCLPVLVIGNDYRRKLRAEGLR